MGHPNLYEVLNGAMDDGTERGIPPGSYVVVEEEPVPLEAGAVYLVETPGGLHLREARWEGAWGFVPWNEGYPSFPLEAVRVVGRVRGVVQYDPLT
jgi:SOS-response transcriptional repressor LexA